MSKIILYEVFQMYLSEKKPDSVYVKPGSFAKIRLTVSSDFVPGLRPLYVRAYRFPCGRIKLVCLFAAAFLSATPENSCYIAVFDSVRSLYNIPGVHVYTDRSHVYAALGMNQCYRD